MNKIFKEIKVSNPSSKMSCFAQAQLGKFSMLGGVGVLPAAESWTVPSWNGKLYHGLKSKYIVTDISLKEPKDLKRCIRFYSRAPTLKIEKWVPPRVAEGAPPASAVALSPACSGVATILA